MIRPGKKVLEAADSACKRWRRSAISGMNDPFANAGFPVLTGSIDVSAAWRGDAAGISLGGGGLITWRA